MALLDNAKGFHGYAQWQSGQIHEGAPQLAPGMEVHGLHGR